MKRNQFALVILIGIIIIGAITNPSFDDHKRQISKILNKETKVDSDNPFEVFGKSLGLSMVEGLLDNLIDVNNYILFSIGSISYQGNERNITIGTFGNIFTLAKVSSDKYKKYEPHNNDKPERYEPNNNYKILEKPLEKPIEDYSTTSKLKKTPHNGIQKIYSKYDGKVVKKVTWRDGERVQVAWLDKFGNTDFVEDCLKGECD